MNSMCHYKPHQLYGLLQAIQYERYGLLQAITIINRYTPNGLAYKVRTQCGKHNRTPEIITIRFAGWISGRIVSLQPDTDIQKLLSNGNRLRISDSLISMFRGFRLWKKLHIAQSFIHYLQKHLLSLLCHDSEPVYGVISVP